MNHTDEHPAAPEPQVAPPADPPQAAGPVTTAGAAGASWPHGRQPFDPRDKSPRLAALLSVIPGLGQIYIGYYQRGFMFAATMLLLGMAAGTAPNNIGPVFGFSMFFVWLFNVVDSGRMAALYNHAMAGSDKVEFPENFEMPGLGGTIAGGTLLLLFGLIALSNTALGFRLDWLEIWWPLFPTLMGAYLLARGIMDRME